MELSASPPHLLLRADVADFFANLASEERRKADLLFEWVYQHHDKESLSAALQLAQAFQDEEDESKKEGEDDEVFCESKQKANEVGQSVVWA